ncbi:hypothetical protein ColTof3_07047 [Colletotrichum tofieldiae]|nr:hypothetical protein ColTof3_07047 [Colletotrichum tofieldiae]
MSSTKLTSRPLELRVLVLLEYAAFTFVAEQSATVEDAYGRVATSLKTATRPEPMHPGDPFPH